MDTINFSLLIYEKEGKLITLYRIPKDIDLNFKLPDTTKYIQIKEYMEFKSRPMLGTILRIYIGKELLVSDLIEIIKKRAIKINIKDSLNLHQEGINEKRLLAEQRTNGEIYISKILENDEIVISDVNEMEKYIRQLSCKLYTLYKNNDDIRRLMKRKK